MGFLVDVAGRDEHEGLPWWEHAGLILDAVGVPVAFDDERLTYQFASPKDLNYVKAEVLLYKWLRMYDRVENRSKMQREFYDSPLTLSHALKKIENSIFDTFYEWLMMDITKMYSKDYDGPPICECTELYLIYEDETPVCAFTANVWVDTELFDREEEFRMGVDFDNLRVCEGFLHEKGIPCDISSTPEKDKAISSIEYELQRKLAALNRSLKDWGAEERLTYALTSDYGVHPDNDTWFMSPPHTREPKPSK